MAESKRHLYWVGGSPCGGKSSVTEILAKHCGIDVYHIDDQIDRWMQIITIEDQPALTKWQSQSWEERWMQPADDLLDFVIRAYDESFQLCLEEIKNIPASCPTIIEGNPLRPQLVKPFLSDNHHAIWLIARDNDLRKYYSERKWAKNVLRTCSNPDKAFSNWMERDIQFAHLVKKECLKENFTYLESNPDKTILDRARQVASHFNFSCAL